MIYSNLFPSQKDNMILIIIVAAKPDQSEIPKMYLY